eukprot:4179960-Prymnesium_polylepis.1
MDGCCLRTSRRRAPVVRSEVVVKTADRTVVGDVADTAEAVLLAAAMLVAVAWTAAPPEARTATALLATAHSVAMAGGDTGHSRRRGIGGGPPGGGLIGGGEGTGASGGLIGGDMMRGPQSEQSLPRLQ